MWIQKPQNILKQNTLVNIKRVSILKKGHEGTGPVLYWMSRDQRVNDNWALSYAIECAENTGQYVMVVFALAGEFLGATWRQYDFMLKGLQHVEANLTRLNIPFTLLIGNPADTLPPFIRHHHISRIIVDFDPLKIKRLWKNDVISLIDISVEEVDAHNIAPCWIASDKEEFAAHTFRPKITRLLPEYLDQYPPLIRQQGNYTVHRTNWEAIIKALRIDRSVKPVEWLTPGEQAAKAVQLKFLETKIDQYAVKRNDPNLNYVSGLSPFLHFGHISAQRLALDIINNHIRSDNTDAFLEELIIRRELSDNFCFYNKDHDKVAGFQPWAKKTLEDHRMDEKEYLYSTEQLELALTHDSLWNAAQLQMVINGKMHGYMRMYWAKKILEWSASPEDAMKSAIYLNDKYQLDGRDPNGYTGCAWSIGGIHDRAWSERPVFGKIRYMNRKGCERKFDVNRYISSMNQLIGCRL
jgi:deoxyribodipyrimidine photo-lyase